MEPLLELFGNLQTQAQEVTVCPKCDRPCVGIFYTSMWNEEEGKLRLTATCEECAIWLSKGVVRNTKSEE